MKIKVSYFRHAALLVFIAVGFIVISKIWSFYQVKSISLNGRKVNFHPGVYLKADKNVVAVEFSNNLIRWMALKRDRYIFVFRHNSTPNEIVDGVGLSCKENDILCRKIESPLFDGFSIVIFHGELSAVIPNHNLSDDTLYHIYAANKERNVLIEYHGDPNKTRGLCKVLYAYSVGVSANGNDRTKWLTECTKTLHYKPRSNINSM